MPRSKRYAAAKALVDAKKLYSLNDALELVKQTSTTKFAASVELHLNLGIDVKKSEQQVRATFVMPHAGESTKKIAAFVPADREKEAKEAGAAIVGGEEMIEALAKSGKIDFDIAVATPDMMPKMAKVAKVLGPKGLMPNPKTDTVGSNVKKMIEELKRGKLSVKNDATGNLHIVVGKTSLGASELAENVRAAFDAIRKVKPASAKGSYIKRVVLTSTMGPGIALDPSSV